MRTSPIPEGYHSITPYLLVDDADQVINFAIAAFGATITEQIKADDGRTTHGEIQIGDSKVMVGGNKGSDGTSTMLYLYVADTDKTYQQALKAGGISVMEPADQFYGDRNAGVQDPQGNKWWIATRVENLTHEELQQRAREFHAAT